MLNVPRFALYIGLSMLWPGRLTADCRHLPAVNAAPAAHNDNRVSAGKLRDGVLSVALVARPVAWYPDGPRGCALRVHGFAEEGKAPLVPGPLIRVPAGTEVRVSVRNALEKVLWVRGLQDHNVALLDSSEIAPGQTREFHFRALAPGAWFYWGGDANANVPRSSADGQLVGALVVDPRESAPRGDRVFVMTRWTPTGEPGNRGFQLNAINGASWPHTERLTMTVGDSARWHVINAADDFHMMHLHGFYFRVEAHGNAARDTVTLSPTGTTVVTNVVRAGEWIRIAWSPERAGNWLFHCHIVAHMSPSQRLDRMRSANPDSAAAVTPHTNHATSAMAGLIVGVTVRPGSSRAESLVTAPRRTLRLFADVRQGVFGDRPGFGFVLQEDTAEPARDSIRIPGTPLVLTQGEPVQINIHNRLDRTLGVHWHGIELESYYDGVAGWSGGRDRIAPTIAPGDSFVVRFTPPRSGTFIYHVHNEDGEELASGLYGALLVVEPQTTFDSSSNVMLVIATAGPGELRPSFVNGRAAPDTLRLVAGKTYRLRIIDINANDSHRTALLGPAGPVEWRQVGRDGWEITAAEQVTQRAPAASAAGVTRDYEFILPTAGSYSITVTHRAAGRNTGHITTLPITAR